MAGAGHPDHWPRRDGWQAAWFLPRLVLDIRPCPLCLEQRYAYYLIFAAGCAGLAASRHFEGGAPRPLAADRLSALWLLGGGSANGLARRLPRRAFEWKSLAGARPIALVRSSTLGSAGTLLQAPRHGKGDPAV